MKEMNVQDVASSVRKATEDFLLTDNTIDQAEFLTWSIKDDLIPQVHSTRPENSAMAETLYCGELRKSLSQYGKTDFIIPPYINSFAAKTVADMINDICKQLGKI